MDYEYSNLLMEEYFPDYINQRMEPKTSEINRDNDRDRSTWEAGDEHT